MIMTGDSSNASQNDMSSEDIDPVIFMGKC